MRSINKKGDAATSETPYVVLAVVLLVLGLSIFLIVKSNFLNNTSARETMCYLSNNVRSGGGIFTFVNLCSLEIVEDPVNLEQFSSLVRRSWWKYLQGEDNDFGNAGDEVFPVYQFTPSEDINLGLYFANALTHSNGILIEDISKSDYAYLEKNTKANTLCFDKSNDENINNLYLKKGETYYIMYYDDQLPHDFDNDILLISSNPDFDAGYWKDIGIGYAVGVGAIVTAALTAGTGVAIYTGGISGASAILAGSSLFVEAVGAKTVLISGIVIADSSYMAYFYVDGDNADSECVSYGFGNVNE